MSIRQNLPTSHIETIADNGNSALAQTLTGGSSASNYCGLGIACSSQPNPKEQDWPRPAGGNGFPGQPVGWGGESIVAGQLEVELKLLFAVDYDDADFDKPVFFAEATSLLAVAKGDPVSATTVLGSTPPQAVTLGDFVWAKGTGPQ